MHIQLHSRIDFAGIPFDPPVSDFTLPWLTGQFLPAAKQRRDTVINAITEGVKKIDAERDRIIQAQPSVGERRANGTTIVNQDLARAARTIADAQIVEVAAKIKAEVDSVSIPALKYLERAALTAKTLGERVFDKLSILHRVSASMKDGELMAYRAACTTMVTGAEPIVLHKLFQGCLDRARPEDYILMAAILRENLKLTKDRRVFMNQQAIDLIILPDFDTAKSALKTIVDLAKEARVAWDNFSAQGSASHARLMKIERGLDRMKLDKDGVPLMGDEE